jgi:antitoxin MazE
MPVAKQIKISPWGGSTGIRIPKSILNAAHLSQNDEVRIAATADGVITITAVSNARQRYKHKTIQERFVNFFGDCYETEVDWGYDVGNEVLDD